MKYSRRRHHRSSLQQLRAAFLGSSQHQQNRRAPFRVETLESRLMLAADLGWDTEPILGEVGATTLPDPSAFSSFSTSPAADESLAEGEQTPARDLVAFAKALDASGAKLYGAAWCPACTSQKAVFEDGADFLPFIESTNLDRTLNQAGIDANITAFPTWVFPDDSRFVGNLSLDEIASRSGVSIPTSVNPSIAPLDDQMVLGGSPLHLGLDGYDPNGDPLTFTVTSSKPSLVTPTVLSGNRSARISVTGWGDMVYELFEGRVPRAAGRFIDLAQSGFYDAANNDPDITMHRVIDDFILQFGDPTGTGAGGSSLGDFDDQFHPDLQHNSPGALSWAKAGDDTNDSQVFVTDVPTRFLDFNHSYFGQLTEGDSVRDALNKEGTNLNPVPSPPIYIDSVQIFQDTENAIVMLKAAEGASGEADITVTATDTDGNQATQTFHVTVSPDPFNGGPYLQEISDVSTTVGTPVTFQLGAVDVENDPVRFDGLKIGTVDYAISVDATTGLATVIPPTGFAGSFDVLVRVRPATTSDTADLYDSQVVSVTVLPETPIGVDLLSSSDSGILDDDNVTNVTNLEFEVLGVTSGATVRLYHGETVIGEATAAGSSVVITTNSLAAMGDGTYTVFATQVIGEQEGAASSGLDVTLDTTPPGAFTSTPPTSGAAGQQLVYNAENPDEATAGVAYSMSNAPSGATIDATNGTFIWTPAITDVGVHSFSIVLGDAAGNARTQDVTVDVTNDNDVRFRLTLEDTQGNPISDIDVGTSFVLNVFIQDLRANAGGAFAAYVDVLYDSQIVGVDGAITHGPQFSGAASGSVSTPGLLDEVGGLGGLSQLDGSEYLLFSVPMQATRAGSFDFLSDPADDNGHEVLLFDSDTATDVDKIAFGSTSLTVNVAFGANDDLFNVDEDSTGTSLDVLANDEVFPGSPGTLVISQVGVTSGGGTVQITDDGTRIQYTPAQDFFGVDTFTYTVDDGTGTEQASVSVQVMPTNDDPTGVDDQFDVMEDTQNTNFDVLANDLITPDADESLTVSGVGTPSAGGTVTVSDDGGHVVYTPAGNFFGDETFTYTISDGNGGSSQATVTVHVAETNDPPSARDDRVFFVEDSLDNPIDVLANDDTGGDTGETLTIIGVSVPEHGGTVSIAADDLSLIYSPATDFFGTERFTYTISDGNGGTAEAAVLVTVEGLNDPPTANNDSFTVVKDTSDQYFAVLENDSSLPDGDELLTLVSVGASTAGGTVALADDGLGLVYAPPTGFTGADSFTYTIEDEGGASAEATVFVDVQEYIPSDLSGFVYMDVNNNGVKDPLEVAIGGVRMTLSGTDTFGAAVQAETITAASGFYAFTGLAPGDYTIEQTQPEQLIDGPETVGSQGGTVGDDQIVVSLQQDTNGQNNNFGERGRQARSISLLDFFASTPHDSVLAIAGDQPSQQWYVIEAGWTRATAMDLQVEDSRVTASLNVTDDAAEQFQTTLELDNPRHVQMLDEYPSSSLLRIVGSPQELFPDADCACAPGEAEAEADSVTQADSGGAEGEPLTLVVPSLVAQTVVQPQVERQLVGSSSSGGALLTTLPTDLGLPTDLSRSSDYVESNAVSQPVSLADTAAVDALMTGSLQQDEPAWWTEERASAPTGHAGHYTEAVDLLMAGFLASSLS